MKRPVAVAVLLALAFPAIAQAGELDRMQEAANAYWGATGVPDNCPTTIRLVDLEAFGETRLLDCTIDLDAEYTAIQLDVIRDHRENRAIRLQAGTELCTLIVHEEGHARGLEHAPWGIMADGSMYGEAPEECYRAVRPMVRRPSAARTSRRCGRGWLGSAPNTCQASWGSTASSGR